MPNPTNSITCVDNPNINFTSIGTPIGKFGECIKDIDGNTYKTVTIGTQTWMAENLKVSKYNDGTPIPNVTDSLQWPKLTTGAWCNYKNNASNNAKFGKLYNWFAINSTSNGNKNVCPSGWHAPSADEWTVLFNNLGGKSVAGGKMKEVGTKSWDSINKDANNLSLFTGIPGGARFLNGNDYFIGNFSYWWISTESNTSYAWGRCLQDSLGQAINFYLDKRIGVSIRCLKD